MRETALGGDRKREDKQARKEGKNDKGCRSRGGRDHPSLVRVTQVYYPLVKVRGV